MLGGSDAAHFTYLKNRLSNSILVAFGMCVKLPKNQTYTVLPYLETPGFRSLGGIVVCLYISTFCMNLYFRVCVITYVHEGLRSGDRIFFSWRRLFVAMYS